jgi:hypothetical protein
MPVAGRKSRRRQEHGDAESRQATGREGDLVQVVAIIGVGATGKDNRRHGPSDQRTITPPMVGDSPHRNPVMSS